MKKLFWAGCAFLPWLWVLSLIHHRARVFDPAASADLRFCESHPRGWRAPHTHVRCAVAALVHVAVWGGAAARGPRPPTRARAACPLLARLLQTCARSSWASRSSQQRL